MASKKVLIVGGGIAGLASAYVLQRSGFETCILEASHRVGGRIRTAREPFAAGLHGELGAMRLPGRHIKRDEGIVGYFLDEFNLRVDLEPFEQRNKLLYLSGLGRAMTYDEFKKRLKTEDQALLKLFPGLEQHEKGKTLDELWTEAMEPVESYRQACLLNLQPQLQREHADGAVIANLVAKALRLHFDDYTLARYLKEVAHWSDACIRLYDICSAHVVLQNAIGESLTDAFLSSEKLGFQEDMQQLKGGLDRLAWAFLKNTKIPLADKIRFGARVKKVEYDPHISQASPITVTYQIGGNVTRTESADYVVFAIPCPTMSSVEITPRFAEGKVAAIREVRYVAVTKILAQFKTRWWEEILSEDYGVGTEGGLVTDLAIRYLAFPHARSSQFHNGQSRGVVMASYTFEGDAQRLGPLTEQAKLDIVRDNLAEIFGADLIDGSLEVSASQSWSTDALAGGAAFAYFAPNQLTTLYPDLVATDWDGRACFAGEHASDWHGWIEGALISAMRATVQVCEHASS